MSDPQPSFGKTDLNLQLKEGNKEIMIDLNDLFKNDKELINRSKIYINNEKQNNNRTNKMWGNLERKGGKQANINTIQTGTELRPRIPQ